MESYRQHLGELLNEGVTHHEAIRRAIQRFHVQLREKYKHLTQTEYFILYEQAEYDLDYRGIKEGESFEDALTEQMVITYKELYQ